MWHQGSCTLVCATDWGPKEKIGTSSYAMYFPQRFEAIVTGRAIEYQPRETASSTRQELLGQLGIQYWMTRLAAEWGQPRRGIQIELVTDSQASIEIMENIPTMIGIKDAIRQEMDVSLELFKQRTEHQWIKWKVCKVESHIDREDVPDSFHWECNNFVDGEATKARLDCPMEDLKQQETFIFPGAKIGCKIDGRIENNSLYEVLKTRINGRVLRVYLMEKYHWTESTFWSID